MTERYRYIECGLDNVYLEGGVERVDSPYGEAVIIHHMEDLHRCIAKCLLEKKGRLDGAEFRFLRTELDLSQEIMGELCGRGERAVRGWEASNEPVPEHANKIIRLVYKERNEPSVTYEGLSKQIKELQALDKEVFELRLVATPEGWEDACQAA